MLHMGFILTWSTGAYGEAEFIFASIKVLTITGPPLLRLFPHLTTHDCGLPGLIILGIILDLGGGPDHDRLGFRYWKHPGPFVQFDGIGGAKGRFLGFWAVLTQAAFSFIGTEIVAVSFLCAHELVGLVLRQMNGFPDRRR
jgi:yeast amino acid transporter